VFDTVRILTRLVDLGGLTRCKPQEGSPAPTSPVEKSWETAVIASSKDSQGLPLSQRPTPLRIGQADVRCGEPNRRKGQRRAAIQTPALGTLIVGREAAETPTAGVPDTAAAPVAPAAAASAARASGSIDVSVAPDRRQSNADRRNRPSVTIDAALVEAVPAPAPAAAPVETAPAESPARSGRVTGTLQVAPPRANDAQTGAHVAREAEAPLRSIRGCPPRPTRLRRWLHVPFPSHSRSPRRLQELRQL